VVSSIVNKSNEFNGVGFNSHTVALLCRVINVIIVFNKYYKKMDHGKNEITTSMLTVTNSK